MRLLFAALLFACACTRSEASPPASTQSPPPAPPPPSASAPSALASAPSAAPRYPFDRTHSPIDAAIVAELSAIAKRGPSLRSGAFAKVGDSITASGDFVRCFASSELPELGDRGELLPLLERFRSSFTRDSEAAKIGWSAWQLLAGVPPPLELEFRASSPRFALVQLGTNDIEIGQIHHFADRLWDAIDWLVDRGVIPILFTIPPRRDRESAAIWVPRYNAVIRGVAQARRVPLVDYHRELLRLPGAGLGKDGIHPTTYHGPKGRNACDLGPEGLRHGYNLRNLLALEALDRAARGLEGERLDPSVPGLAAEGSLEQPQRVSSLPFVELVRFPASGRLSSYAGCAGAREAAGPEQVFRIESSRAITLRAFGFDRAGEVDLYLLSEPRPEACRARAERVLEARLGPGWHTLVLEASVPEAETLVVLLAE
jgi:hypothetical protein